MVLLRKFIKTNFLAFKNVLSMSMVKTNQNNPRSRVKQPPIGGCFDSMLQWAVFLLISQTCDEIKINGTSKF